jgi:hypothetical protein
VRAVRAVPLCEVEDDRLVRDGAGSEEDETDEGRRPAVLVEEDLRRGAADEGDAAETTVKEKMAAEAPLNLRALTQIMSAPATGAMLPARYAATSLAPIERARWKRAMLPPISTAVTSRLNGIPLFAGCALSP